LQKHIQGWLAKRFRIDGQRTLKQRDILVFMYQQGYLYLVLILITFIAGVNYANNLILGFCFLISAVLCISFYLVVKQLHQLKIEVIVPEVGRVGQAMQIEIIFYQEREIVRYLNLYYAKQIIPVLVQHKQQRFHLLVWPEERGPLHLQRLQIYSTYPFGLVRAWTYLYLEQMSWIAPQALDFKAENAAQNALKQAQDMDEFQELRDFKTGNSYHAVSWKQAARGQGLYIKVFESYPEQNKIEICYEHMPSSEHEEKLSLMMGLVDQCEQQQCPYRLVLPQDELATGSGEAQFQKAQKLLAQA